MNRTTERFKRVYQSPADYASALERPRRSYVNTVWAAVALAFIAWAVVMAVAVIAAAILAMKGVM
jgi:hypothetical protein